MKGEIRETSAEPSAQSAHRQPQEQPPSSDKDQRRLRVAGENLTTISSRAVLRLPPGEFPCESRSQKQTNTDQGPFPGILPQAPANFLPKFILTELVRTCNYFKSWHPVTSPFMPRITTTSTPSASSTASRPARKRTRFTSSQAFCGFMFRAGIRAGLFIFVSAFRRFTPLSFG